MSRLQLATLCRALADLGGSYVLLGLAFRLFIRQTTPYLLFGLPAALAALAVARGLDPAGGTFRQHALTILSFAVLQVVAWRYFYFFRDPERRVEPGAAVVAPADGYVVYVRRVEDGNVPLAIKEERRIPLEELTGVPAALTEPVLIGIFMTPMSVHVNRAPIAGTLSEKHDRGGRKLNMLPMSLRTMFGRRPFERGSRHVTENERQTLRIDGADFPVYVTRIADLYVDKIETWKELREPVAQGERIGLIKMGSQTDTLFPLRAGRRRLRVCVRDGEYVYGGQTALARWDDEAGRPPFPSATP